jgi:hypothetical protein
MTDLLDISCDEINGKWFAVRGGCVLAGPFRTNREAWHWIDRQQGLPVSRSEHVAEWIRQKTSGAGRD